MFSEFITEKLRAARYERLEDGIYFDEIPRLQGV